ncbi:hypothetical protein NPIL_450091 [Nephila pilipes]|uniref:Spider venom protein n=1 Tax=Nephila pilipes TaxID=299642 RepID=A0A8X6R447_NEPPI|nr:hypothetical protein NPIL_450091 [Nephila pilipes]
MHLLAVGLLVLLTTGFSFAEELNEETAQQMRALFCDEELAGVRDLIMECVKLVDWTEYESLFTKCGSGMETFDIEKMRQNACQGTNEEMIQVDECITSNINEAGKKD